MKYTFETDDHDEAVALINSGICYTALFEVDNILRNYLKHGSENSPRTIMEEMRRILGEVRNRIE